MIPIRLIQYATDAPRDFEKLKSEVTSRLKAFIERSDVLQRIGERQQLAPIAGGKALYEKIRPNDEKQTAPKGLFVEILKEGRREDCLPGSQGHRNGPYWLCTRRGSC